MRVSFARCGSVATGLHHIEAEPPPKSVRSDIIFVLSQGARTCLRPKTLIRVGVVIAIAGIAIVAIILFLLFRDSSTAYAAAYSEQIDAGKSGTVAREYAEEIIAGHSPRYARAYSEQIEAGISEEVARAYAEYMDADFSYDSGGSRSDFRYFPLAGIRPVPANQAVTQSEAESEPESTGSVSASSEQAINTVVVLAIYSTTLDTEASKRAVSVGEITSYIEQADVDNTTLLGLLNDIAPEASIDERMEASRNLASISDNSDGELTPEQSMEVANEMTRLITGHGIDAEQRTAAAREI